MNPVKLIRQFGKILRGGAGRRDMFLGIFLGFAVGMTPGVNLTVVVLVLAMLFLNTNGVLAALSIALGKVLALMLAPVTFRIGYFAIHQLGLVGVIRWAANTPVLALLDLHVYCLIGAIPFIVIVGGALGILVPRWVSAARARVASAVGGSEKLQHAGASRFARVFMRIVFGKQRGTFAEMAGRKTPLVRKGRVVVAAVLVAVLAVLQWLFLDSLVAGGIEKSIASANGAEVNIASVDLSLTGGRLIIEGLEVTDAARPTHNQVQAERIVTDVSIADLLAKRFLVDLLECHALKTDVQRSCPGEVYEPKERPEPETDLLAGLGKSAEYYRQIKKFNERLQKLRDYLKSDEPKEQPDPEDLARRAKAEGYLRLSAKDYLAESPTWVIRRLQVSQVQLRPDLPTFTVVGENLSSHPSLVEEDAELTARPDIDALKAFLAKSGGDKGGALGGLLGGQKAGQDAGATGDKKGLLGGLLGSKDEAGEKADESETAEPQKTEEKKSLLKGILGK